MSVTDSAELKKQLRSAGFEIYRTTATHIQLAERVRDNLIMDSGVAALLGSELGVTVTVRAQASHFPGANQAQVWAHARKLAQEFQQLGYGEEGSKEERVADPSDPSQSLDTSHEITLLLSVTSIDNLFEELRSALSRRRSTSDD